LTGIDFTHENRVQTAKLTVFLYLRIITDITLARLTLKSRWQPERLFRRTKFRLLDLRAET
jgi:hypothetical protein